MKSRFCFPPWCITGSPVMHFLLAMSEQMFYHKEQREDMSYEDYEVPGKRHSFYR